MSCLFHFISNSTKGPQKEKPPRLPAPGTPVKVKPTFCIYDSDDSGHISCICIFEKNGIVYKLKLKFKFKFKFVNLNSLRLRLKV